MTENDNGCCGNGSASGNRSSRTPQSTGPAFTANLEPHLLPKAPGIVGSLSALMRLTPPQAPEIVFDDFTMPAWNIDLLVREGLIEPLRPPRTEGSEGGTREDGSHLYRSEDGTDVLDLLGCYDAHAYKVTLFVQLIDLCAAQLALRRVAKRSRYWRGEVTRMCSNGVMKPARQGRSGTIEKGRRHVVVHDRRVLQRRSEAR